MGIIIHLVKNGCHMNQGEIIQTLCALTIENEVTRGVISISSLSLQLDVFSERGERVGNIDSSQNLTGLRLSWSEKILGSEISAKFHMVIHRSMCIFQSVHI
jgi:hypothetical protein